MKHYVPVFRTIRRTLCLCVCVGVIMGCDSLSYYKQAAVGQYRILKSRRPIQALLAAEETDAGLKERLALLADIRAFARDELKLPVEGHYETYAELGRRYVVWNVFAAPEFSLAPKTWRYPLVGSLVYRGYFDREEALGCAAALERRGFDVHVSGASAYSTLGWFADPVVSTMIHRPPDDLAALIFHELAHQVLYIKSDTRFNESFAVAVEEEGLRRWLAARGTPERFERYRAAKEREAAFRSLLVHCRRQLADLYRGELAPDRMRRRKAAIFQELRDDYAELKQSWGGYSGYDGWFRRPLNNARFVPVAVYTDWVPAFSAVLAAKEGDMERFFAECRRLAALPDTERNGIMTAYLGEAPLLGQLGEEEGDAPAPAKL